MNDQDKKPAEEQKTSQDVKQAETLKSVAAGAIPPQRVEAVFVRANNQHE